MALVGTVCSMRVSVAAQSPAQGRLLLSVDEGKAVAGGPQLCAPVPSCSSSTSSYPVPACALVIKPGYGPAISLTQEAAHRPLAHQWSSHLVPWSSPSEVLPIGFIGKQWSPGKNSRP